MSKDLLDGLSEEEKRRIMRYAEKYGAKEQGSTKNLNVGRNENTTVDDSLRESDDLVKDNNKKIERDVSFVKPKEETNKEPREDLLDGLSEEEKRRIMKYAKKYGTKEQSPSEKPQLEDTKKEKVEDTSKNPEDTAKDEVEETAFGTAEEVSDEDGFGGNAEFKDKGNVYKIVRDEVETTYKPHEQEENALKVSKAKKKTPKRTPKKFQKRPDLSKIIEKAKSGIKTATGKIGDSIIDKYKKLVLDTKEENKGYNRSTKDEKENKGKNTIVDSEVEKDSIPLPWETPTENEGLDDDYSELPWEAPTDNEGLDNEKAAYTPEQKSMADSIIDLISSFPNNNDDWSPIIRIEEDHPQNYFSKRNIRKKNNSPMPNEISHKKSVDNAVLDSVYSQESEEIIGSEVSVDKSGEIFFKKSDEDEKPHKEYSDKFRKLRYLLATGLSVCMIGSFLNARLIKKNNDEHFKQQNSSSTQQNENSVLIFEHPTSFDQYNKMLDDLRYDAQGKHFSVYDRIIKDGVKEQWTVVDEAGKTHIIEDTQFEMYKAAYRELEEIDDEMEKYCERKGIEKPESKLTNIVMSPDEIIKIKNEQQDQLNNQMKGLLENSTQQEQFIEEVMHNSEISGKNYNNKLLEMVLEAAGENPEEQNDLKESTIRRGIEVLKNDRNNSEKSVSDSDIKAEEEER